MVEGLETTVVGGGKTAKKEGVENGGAIPKKPPFNKSAFIERNEQRRKDKTAAQHAKDMDSGSDNEDEAPDGTGGIHRSKISPP